MGTGGSYHTFAAYLCQAEVRISQIVLFAHLMALEAIEISRIQGLIHTALNAFLTGAVMPKKTVFTFLEGSGFELKIQNDTTDPAAAAFIRDEHVVQSEFSQSCYKGHMPV